MSSKPPESTERKLFKEYFDSDAARALARQIASARADFPEKSFVRMASRNLDELEFHARVRQFSDALRASLPPDIPQALDILTRSLPPPLETTDCISEGWRQWPVGQFIADHGTPHFHESMEAMIELTQRFTSEFALRPFLETNLDRVLSRLLDLTGHENAHVRRWCSEGTRPRLPWAKRLDALVIDPSPTLPILHALRDDADEYVLRSVGNHLNDIAKDHPAVVVKICRQWLQESPVSRRRVVERALRTLVKSGDAAALETLGVRPAKAVDTTLVLTPGIVTIGDSIQCTATLRNRSTRPCLLLIDYIVTYARENGRSSRKVFKWTRREIQGSETITLTKTHPMRPVSTRSLHPGVHSIALQINGRECSGVSFILQPGGLYT